MQFVFRKHLPHHVHFHSCLERDKWGVKGIPARRIIIICTFTLLKTSIVSTVAIPWGAASATPLVSEPSAVPRNCNPHARFSTCPVLIDIRGKSLVERLGVCRGGSDVRVTRGLVRAGRELEGLGSLQVGVTGLDVCACKNGAAQERAMSFGLADSKRDGALNRRRP